MLVQLICTSVYSLSSSVSPQINPFYPTTTETPARVIPTNLIEIDYLELRNGVGSEKYITIESQHDTSSYFGEVTI